MTEQAWLERTRRLAEQAADPVLLRAGSEDDKRQLAAALDSLVESTRAQAFAVEDVDELAVAIDRLEHARRALRGQPAPRRRRWWRRGR